MIEFKIQAIVLVEPHSWDESLRKKNYPNVVYTGAALARSMISRG